jgi:hypothetical protein
VECSSSDKLRNCGWELRGVRGELIRNIKAVMSLRFWPLDNTTAAFNTTLKLEISHITQSFNGI